jgi:glycosyltransferase involved in cell wall biosynthesis
MAEVPEISVVVPVFNSGAMVPQVLKAISDALVGRTWEVILVDDGSTDNTWQQICALAGGNVHALRLGRNYGQQNATLAGLSRATGVWTVTMDDDLQHDPALIPDMIKTAEETGAQLVYADFGKRHYSIPRKIVRGFARFLITLSGTKYTPGSSFRLLDATLRRQVSMHNGHQAYLDEIMLWHTQRLAYVPAVHGKSLMGRSRYRSGGLFSWSVDFMYFTAQYHLQMLSRIGLAVAAVNFLIGSFYIYRKIVHKVSISGYTSLIVSILFSTGLIIFAIAQVSAYLSRIYMMQNGKPCYSIAEER